MTRTPLTERYLYAAARYLPEAQRAAFRQDLAERIADTVEAKQSAGARSDDAEHATLVELGPPNRLAAQYADRPLQLIGPRYYMMWRQLLWLLVPIVAAVAAAGATIGNVIDARSTLAVVGGALHAAWLSVIIVSFVVTVVFAVLERYDPTTLTELDPATSWKPEHLPEPTHRETTTERVVEAVWLCVLGALVLLANQFSYVHDGTDVRLFEAATWSWLRWALLALVVADLVLTIVAIARRDRWLVVGRVLVDVATCALLVPVLMSGRLVDPEFLTAAGWPEGVDLFASDGALTAVAVGVVVIACALDAIGAVRGLVRRDT